MKKLYEKCKLALQQYFVRGNEAPPQSINKSHIEAVFCMAQKRGQGQCSQQCIDCKIIAKGLKN